MPRSVWWPSGRRSSACARRPRPISATAFSRWRRIWRRAACSVSAPTATPRRRPPPSSGCSSMASALPICVGSRWRPRGQPHCGSGLWSHALTGGARAAGRRQAVWPRASAPIWLSWTPITPAWSAAAESWPWISLVFAPGTPVRDVMVGGAWRLRDGPPRRRSRRRSRLSQRHGETGRLGASPPAGMDWRGPRAASLLRSKHRLEP